MSLKILDSLVIAILCAFNVITIWILLTMITLPQHDDPLIDDITYGTVLRWKCSGHFNDRGYTLKTFEDECNGKALRYLDENNGGGR